MPYMPKSAVPVNSGYMPKSAIPVAVPAPANLVSDADIQKRMGIPANFNEQVGKYIADQAKPMQPLDQSAIDAAVGHGQQYGKPDLKTRIGMNIANFAPEVVRGIVSNVANLGAHKENLFTPEGRANAAQLVTANEDAAQQAIPNYYDIPAPKNMPEKVADVGVGLGKFMTELLLAKKIVPPTTVLNDAAAWEIVNRLDDGTPGMGAAMSLGLRGLGKLPAGIALPAESAGFAGLAKLDGGDSTDVMINALLPVALRTPKALDFMRSKVAEIRQQQPDITPEQLTVKLRQYIPQETYNPEGGITDMSPSLENPTPLKTAVGIERELQPQKMVDVRRQYEDFRAQEIVEPQGEQLVTGAARREVSPPAQSDRIVPSGEEAMLEQATQQANPGFQRLPNKFQQEYSPEGGRTFPDAISRIEQAKVEGKGIPKIKDNRGGYTPLFNDLLTVSRDLFNRGYNKIQPWAKELIRTVGDWVMPHLNALWKSIKESANKPRRGMAAYGFEPSTHAGTTMKSTVSPELKERKFVTSVKSERPDINAEGTYSVRSTEELAQKAKNLIKDDIAKAEQVAARDNGQEGVAVASELIKHYSDRANSATNTPEKDMLNEKAAGIANNIARKLTDLGRGVQAASILARLTPEGQARFAAREIQRYNEEVERSSGGIGGLKKKIPELTGEQFKNITKEMADINKMPDGWEKALRFQKLHNSIADLIPTPFYKKVIAVWKAGLLTGLKTSGVNIGSNISHLLSETVKDIPATVVDKAASLLTGQRTVTTNINGIAQGLKEGAKRGIRYIRTGYDERNIGTKLDIKRVNMGKNIIAKGAQTYTDTVFHILGAEDQPFYYATKTRSLYEQAKVDAINKGFKNKPAQLHIENLIKNPTNKMLENATHDAEMAVFANETNLGKVAKYMQKLPFLGEIIIPFGRTPSAIAMQIINYTPVGIAKTVIENAGKGRFSQRQFSQAIGRGITGTAVMAIGAAMYDNGLISLNTPSSEKERRLNDIEGKNSNAVLIDGKWRSVQTLGPLGNVLLSGAHFKKAFKESGSPSEAITTALGESGASFLDQTFLQGLKSFINAVTSEGGANKFVADMAGSTVPTLVGDIAKATDDKDRQSVTASEKIQAKIPGLRNKLQPQIDVLGNESPRSGNAIETLADPTRPSNTTQTFITKELRRLWDAGYKVSPSLVGGRKGYEKLTPEENTELRKNVGSMINDKLYNHMNSSRYDNISDEVKAKYIDAVSRRARLQAKVKFLRDKFGSPTKQRMKTYFGNDD